MWILKYFERHSDCDYMICSISVQKLGKSHKSYIFLCSETKGYYYECQSVKNTYDLQH